jgi:hypothetical protein
MSLDSIMLTVIELSLVALVVYSARQNTRFLKKIKNDGTNVKRGPKSMNYFYTAFAGATGVLVAIPLNVESASGFRIPLVLLNFVTPAYLCFLNAWFRNSLMGWIQWVAENIE